MKTPRCSVLLAIGGLLSGLTASATGPNEVSVYSTLTASSTYNSSFARALFGESSSYGFWETGNQFAPTAGGTLSSIEVALGNYLQVPQHVTVRLAPNGPGDLPSDTTLVSGTVVIPYSPYFTASLVSFMPSSPVSIAADTLYWVVVTPADDTDAGWYFNSLGLTGRTAFRHDFGVGWIGHSTEGQAAFRVNVLIPEPTTPTLIVVGAGLLAAWRSLTKSTTTRPASVRRSLRLFSSAKSSCS